MAPLIRLATDANASEVISRTEAVTTALTNALPK
jgi:hypothetical protein